MQAMGIFANMTAQSNMLIQSNQSGSLFRHAPLKHRGRLKAIERYWAQFDKYFDKQSDMIGYLDALAMPVSGKWAYGRIPETGTRSVLAALHYLEFGVPITTIVSDPYNSNDNEAAHTLDEAGIFMSPLQTTLRPETLQSALRMTVLRDPIQRALSSFHNICRSHKNASRQLAPLRLRLSAATGFNWETHVDTALGFNKLLDFIADTKDMTTFQLDRRFAPQVKTMPRTILRPYLVGRTEELPRFLSRLAEELDLPLPVKLVSLCRNTSPKTAEIVVNNSLRRKIQHVFSEDYEWYESL